MSTYRKINGIISSISSWDELFASASTLTKQEKGALFEKLTELVFKTKPIYKSKYKNVWLLREGIDSKIKERINLPNADEGIDLIAETYAGAYCAIQCKFKGANEAPTRKDIATFLDLSRNHCRNISEQILVHTGTNGIKKTSLLPDSFTQVGLDFWSTLSDEDWRAVRNVLKSKADRVTKRKPRRHQIEAIDASIKYFVKAGNKRGKLIMPCGTGKSLTAYWISESLKSKATIVAVPSLALIKQSLEDWTKEMLLTKRLNLPDWICICSDESTGRLTDDFVTDTYSLGIPTTTNSVEIENFLKAKSAGGKVIFTTYQSAEKLSKVSKKINYKFDLAVLDEAHKTVGNSEKSFSTLLKDSDISIDKRIFMTATERIVKGASEDILSMDDASVYGNVFYQLSFKKAIEQNIITDYKIVTVLINEYEINELVQKNKYLSDRKRKIDQAESQMLTTALALKKAKSEYGLNHIVSFHKSIAAAKEFQSLYQKIDTGKKRPEVYHISSKINAGGRAKLLNEFRQTEKAIITNARCLTEGVDVPAIDCVLFADDKHSVVDIVQASGRALRQFTNNVTGKKKEIGFIVIPVILNSKETFDDLTNSDRFKAVIRIVTCLSTQDETITEELKLIDAGKQKAGSGKIQFCGIINRAINLSVNDFSKKISTKIWEKAAKVNWRNYSDCLKYTRLLKLKNVKEWRKYCVSGHKPLDIPSKPFNTFYSEWGGWNEWLGAENKNNWEKADNRLNYTEAKSFLKIECRGIIKSMAVFNKWKNGLYSNTNLPDFPERMPKNPINTYSRSGEWVDNYDFFGTVRKTKKIKISRPDFKYEKIDYKELKFTLKNRGLNTRDEYQKWLKRNKEIFYKINKYAPLKPDVSYGKAFEGWAIFLNSKNSISIAKSRSMVFMSFEQARNFVIKLKLKSKDEWYDYIAGKIYKQSPRLPNIPKNPSTVYKSKGWVSWPHWLGK